MLELNQDSILTSPPKKDEVMVVDDNPENLNLLADILVDEGFKVRPVTNARFALNSIHISPPDIILLDIRMPEVDGFTFCRIVKKEKKNWGIPIIFVSALNDLDSKIKGFKTGGVDYVSKPFQREEIVSRIRTHLTLVKIQSSLKEKNALLEKEIACRLKAERRLKQINAEIEERIKKRTAELKSLNDNLNRKEKDLIEKNVQLRKLNSALKSMLDKRIIEKRAIEECMVSNIKKFVTPHLLDLSNHISDDEGKAYLSIIKKNLEELIAPIDNTISIAYSKLTATEIKVADLIRQEYKTKEIADILKVSPYTVSNFRHGIRKKLGLTKLKINLGSYLNTLIK